MGYCMRTTDSRVSIKVEDKPDALAAVLAIMNDTHNMHGGGGGRRWYSFLNDVRPDEWQTLEDALRDWRWNPEVDGEGNIIALWFTGEKWGDDEHLFKALTPFIQPDSYIRMVGEDGDTWDFLGNLS